MTMTIDSSLPSSSYWLPFTANRSFYAQPRMMASAKGMFYQTTDGRSVLDGCAGLWCVNAGHNPDKIVAAIQAQAETLTYSPAFQIGHPLAFEFAGRLADLFPGPLNHVFFSNSGSEAGETALKIARAYWTAKGEPQRMTLIGRARGYHGVNFGGMSLGGIAPNKAAFGPLLEGVDHLPDTHDLEKNAFSRGQPDHGVERADALNDLVARHGVDTIAAVIVEPVAGSAGVLPPPVGYLERLREICDTHGILLIFDEVITGFGRLGASSATEALGVQPDILTTAKGLTNGAVPMGATIISDTIHEALMTGPDNVIELLHGYTYSGHPLACAAGMATLDIYRDEGLFDRARDLAPYWQEAVHSLQGARHVIDIRNLGLMAGIELEPRAGEPTARAFEVYLKCFEAGLLTRTTGDIIALSPPLIVEKPQIDQMMDMLRSAIESVA